MALSIFKIYKSQVKIDLNLITSYIETTYSQNEKVLEEIDRDYTTLCQAQGEIDSISSALEDKSYLYNVQFKRFLFSSYFSFLTSFFDNNLIQICKIYFNLNPSNGGSININQFQRDSAKTFLKKTIEIQIDDLNCHWEKIAYYIKIRNLLVHCDSKLKNYNKEEKNLFRNLKTNGNVEIDKNTDEINFVNLEPVYEFKACIEEYLMTIIDRILENSKLEKVLKSK